MPDDSAPPLQLCFQLSVIVKVLYSGYRSRKWNREASGTVAQCCGAVHRQTGLTEATETAGERKGVGHAEEWTSDHRSGRVLMDITDSES